MDSIHKTLAWFHQAKPHPTAADVSVQLGCHYEEVAEGLAAMGDLGTAKVVSAMGNVYKSAPASFITHIECLSDKTKVELLDALCGQIVTAVGVAALLKMDIEGALEEVNRADWSKFVDGVPQFDDQGKVSKGPDYTPPELLPFIGNQNAG